MSETKITQLTRDNVTALHEALTDEEKRQVTIEKTVAVFHMDARSARELIDTVRSRVGREHGTRHTTYRSLHAVVRKLEMSL